MPFAPFLGVSKARSTGTNFLKAKRSIGGSPFPLGRGEGMGSDITHATRLSTPTIQEMPRGLHSQHPASHKSRIHRTDAPKRPSKMLPWRLLLSLRS
jgi:hypothetical protein